MWARVWETLAAAEESLKAEVFSLGEPGGDVDVKGLLEDIPVRPGMEESMAVVQEEEEEELVPQERVQRRTVDVPNPAGVRRDSRGGQIGAT